jgi:hypothetical protein
MRKSQQVEFVQDFVDTIEERITGFIAKGKIPETWDGIELRQLILDEVKINVTMQMTGKRKKDYKNILLTELV